AKYPEYAALRGDPSDNLPGVPGVGEKTAAKLINEYGDLDGVFAHLDELTPKLRENLAAHAEQVRSNAKCTPLVRDLPLDVDTDQLRMAPWDPEQVRKLFNFLEFRTLYDRLIEAVGAPAGAVDAPVVAEPFVAEVTVVRDAAGAAGLLERLAGVGAPVAIAPTWAGEQGRSSLAGLAVTTGDGAAAYFAGDLLEAPEVVAALVRLFGDDGPPLWAHGAKELLRGLDRIGVDVCSLELDTAAAAYLVDPAESQYVLEELAARFAGVELRSPDPPPSVQPYLAWGE